jgi:hypothetical protein
MKYNKTSVYDPVQPHTIAVRYANDVTDVYPCAREGDRATANGMWSVPGCQSLENFGRGRMAGSMFRELAALAFWWANRPLAHAMHESSWTFHSLTVGHAFFSLSILAKCILLFLFHSFSSSFYISLSFALDTFSD